jgi:hypothetical protein
LKEYPKPKQAAMVKGSFPIVAFEVSAGGLEAYKGFFLAQTRRQLKPPSAITPTDRFGSEGDGEGKVCPPQS